MKEEMPSPGAGQKDDAIFRLEFESRLINELIKYKYIYIYDAFQHPYWLMNINRLHKLWIEMMINGTPVISSSQKGSMENTRDIKHDSDEQICEWEGLTDTQTLQCGSMTVQTEVALI